MTLSGQRLQPDRYTLIPRTLTFLTRGDEILLIRIGPDRGAWAGLLNGVGGHIERGEDPLASARREIQEETGLTPGDLKLAGVVIVDTGEKPGIGLYVFIGEAPSDELDPGSEGTLEWIPLAELDQDQLVADLPALIPRALAMRENKAPFSALYVYDDNEELTIRFSA
jgi:8-oxo-dGTP diphosphatase